MSVNWVGVETMKEVRILNALHFALNKRSIPEIARETGIPKSSLYSIRKSGPYAHRNKVTGRIGPHFGQTGLNFRDVAITR